MGYSEDEPIHVVVAKDTVPGQCFVVTVYKPDRNKWSDAPHTHQDLGQFD